MPAGELGVVVQHVGAVPAEDHVAEAEALFDRGPELLQRDEFAAQQAVDVETADLDPPDAALRESVLQCLRVHACSLAADRTMGAGSYPRADLSISRAAARVLSVTLIPPSIRAISSPCWSGLSLRIALRVRPFSTCLLTWKCALA